MKLKLNWQRCVIIIIILSLQFLSQSIEEFFTMGNCQDLINNEYRNRALEQKQMRCNRDKTFGNRDIYCCYAEHSHSNTVINVKKYEILLNKWEYYRTFSMQSVRKKLDILVDGDKIYVFGGFENETILRSVRILYFYFS